MIMNDHRQKKIKALEAAGVPPEQVIYYVHNRDLKLLLFWSLESVHIVNTTKVITMTLGDSKIIITSNH